MSFINNIADQFTTFTQTAQNYLPVLADAANKLKNFISSAKTVATKAVENAPTSSKVLAGAAVVLAVATVSRKMAQASNPTPEQIAQTTELSNQVNSNPSIEEMIEQYNQDFNSPSTEQPIDRDSPATEDPKAPSDYDLLDQYGMFGPMLNERNLLNGQISSSPNSYSSSSQQTHTNSPLLRPTQNESAPSELEINSGRCEDSHTFEAPPPQQAKNTMSSESTESGAGFEVESTLEALDVSPTLAELNHRPQPAIADVKDVSHNEEQHNGFNTNLPPYNKLPPLSSHSDYIPSFLSADLNQKMPNPYLDQPIPEAELATKQLEPTDEITTDEDELSEAPNSDDEIDISSKINVKQPENTFGMSRYQWRKKLKEHVQNKGLMSSLATAHSANPSSNPVASETQATLPAVNPPDTNPIVPTLAKKNEHTQFINSTKSDLEKQFKSTNSKKPPILSNPNQSPEIFRLSVEETEIEEDTFEETDSLLNHPKPGPVEFFLNSLRKKVTPKHPKNTVTQNESEIPTPPTIVSPRTWAENVERAISSAAGGDIEEIEDESSEDDLLSPRTIEQNVEYALTEEAFEESASFHRKKWKE